jgi:hypothetical protein
LLLVVVVEAMVLLLEQPFLEVVQVVVLVELDLQLHQQVAVDH